MVIWLKSGPQAVGIDADVVRAEELARVTDLNNALEALHELVAATMSDATERARELVEIARREADAFVGAARRKFDNSARLGYAAGHRQALADAHGRLLASVRSEQEQLHASADHLSRIVMKAVEQVIAQSDRDALMRRVALTVTRAIDDATHLSVTVSPADAQRARQLFGELGQTAVPPLNVDVIVDDQAAEGICICEWDYGVVEANLGAQLASLSRALAKGAASAAAAGAAPWNDRQPGRWDGEDGHDGPYGEDE
jgi:type III secretion protein L